MNYLAHIYLSGDNEQVKIGNFIADFLERKLFENLPLQVQQGVLLHKHIDTFTDNHTIFKTSKKRLFKEFRHYSAVIVDMFYDHFLAKNFERYSETPLLEFSLEFYDILERNTQFLPENVIQLIPVIKRYNWLYSYADVEQLKSILNQMNNRTSNITKLQDSVITLKKDYTLFGNEFFEFFEELRTEVERKKLELGIN